MLFSNKVGKDDLGCYKTPENLKIRRVTKEIVSWLYSLSRTSTKKPESLNPPSIRKLGAFLGGTVSSRDWELQTNFLLDLHKNKES